MSTAPATLPRHELTGLPVRVVGSTDQSLVGVEGRVVRETASTLVVRSADDGASRDRTVQKRGTTFEFALGDDAVTRTVPPAAGDRHAAGSSAAAWDAATRVTVDGARLEARPAERTETTGDSTWR